MTLLLLLLLGMMPQTQTKTVEPPAYCFGSTTVSSSYQTPPECTKWILEHISPPEPMDVPAILDEHYTTLIPRTDDPEEWQREGCENVHRKGLKASWGILGCSITGPNWTCSDKSRILLTAEDGTRHCVKFGGK